MSELVFVDTNILVYAPDVDAGVKRDRAIAALSAFWDSRTGRPSAQLLQEFYVNATRKLTTPIARTTAREIVGAYSTWVTAPTGAPTVIRAIELSEAAQLSFWDALIVAATENATASLLYSEDLNAGQ